MKHYPRIYSLSTLGLIHHQEFDYLFHPFRTDFIGESGSGKSMIADLIQLIFVGADAFESATTATKDRAPEGMLLTDGGHSNTIGYAFLNIEMQPQQYLVVGAYIETGNKNVQAFIIQQGFDKDNITYLENPLSYKDIIKDEDIQPLDRLKELLSEKGLYCQSWSRLKKYHELLYRENVIPIDLAVSDKQLKNYAEILQSFSRGKLLDTRKSNSLKDFLFGREEANKIYDTYKAAVKEMEAAIGEYGSNLEQITRVTAKYDSLLGLRKNREERDRHYKDWTEKQLLYAYQEEVSIHKEMVNGVTEFVTAKQHHDILQKLLIAEKSELNSLLPSLKLESQAANNAYHENWNAYKEIEKVQNWLQECNCTLGQLPDKYATHNGMRSRKTSLSHFIQTLRSQQLETAFENIDSKENIESLTQFLNDTIADLKTQIEQKEMLQRFSDLSNPDSLAYWALQQKRALSMEEESVILTFQNIPRQKTPGKPQYLPSPDKFMQALEMVEKEKDGFWINLNGIRHFVAYTTRQIFDTADTAAIISYFSSYSKSLKQEISEQQKISNDYAGIQKILLQLSNPSEALDAYRNKDEVEHYKTIEALNVGANEFAKALETYENKAEIEATYFDAKQRVEDFQTSIQNTEALLKAYNLFDSILPKTAEDFISELAEDSEWAAIIEGIYKNEELTKRNVQSSFAQSTDKIAFIKKEQNAIQPKLFSISNIQSKQIDYNKRTEELEKAQQQYLRLYSAMPETLHSETFIVKPDKEYNALMTAEISYAKEYKNVMQLYIPAEAFQLEEEDNLSELAKNLLPEAFHEAVLSDTSEGTIIETIANYLHRINDRNRQLNNGKIQKIKDLLYEVEMVTASHENIIRRIDNFLKNETRITGGYKARLKKTTSPLFPKEWMTVFVEKLEDTSNTFNNKLAEKIDLEGMIVAAFLECGGHPGAQVTAQKLLDPSVYYEIEFNMQTESGRVNTGSTGQTYAAIALLCIARLSVIDKEEGKKQQPAVRIMPIDEAEGLGSNYDMLHDIAAAYDYQILSLSIGPVGRFKDGEQYLYMLHKNMEVEAAVNYTPMAVLCDADKAKLDGKFEI